MCAIAPLAVVACVSLLASTAHAASIATMEAPGLALELARDVLFSGAAIVDGVVRFTGSLGFGAFGFQVEHADGAACASVQGVGFAFLGVTALVIIALGRMRMMSEQRRMDVARRLIERGLTPPEGLIVAPARRDLRRGVVSLCAGIGLCAAGLLLSDRALGAAGLVPAFIGLGYLVSYRLAVGEGLASAEPDARGDPLQAPTCRAWADLDAKPDHPNHGGPL